MNLEIQNQNLGFTNEHSNKRISKEKEKILVKKFPQKFPIYLKLLPDFDFLKTKPKPRMYIKFC